MAARVTVRVVVVLISVKGPELPKTERVYEAEKSCPFRNLLQQISVDLRLNPSDIQFISGKEPNIPIPEEASPEQFGFDDGRGCIAAIVEWGPEFRAVSQGDVAAVAGIQDSLNFEWKSVWVCIAVNVAARFGQELVMRQLLRLGGNPHHLCEEHTPLYSVARYWSKIGDYFVVAQLLVEAGASPFSMEPNGETPFGAVKGSEFEEQFLAACFCGLKARASRSCGGKSVGMIGCQVHALHSQEEIRKLEHLVLEHEQASFSEDGFEGSQGHIQGVKPAESRSFVKRQPERTPELQAQNVILRKQKPVKDPGAQQNLNQIVLMQPAPTLQEIFDEHKGLRGLSKASVYPDARARQVGLLSHPPSHVAFTMESPYAAEGVELAQLHARGAASNSRQKRPAPDQQESSCKRSRENTGMGSRTHLLPPITPRLCRRAYAAAFVATLKLPAPYFNVKHNKCYCDLCYPHQNPDTIKKAGVEPYIVPRGWVRFGLKVNEGRAEALNIWKGWSTSYHGVKNVPVLKSILANGGLRKPGDMLLDGSEVRSSKCAGRQNRHFFTSPTIRYAGLKFYAEPQSWHNGAMCASMVIQCKQKPGTYYKQGETMKFSARKPQHLEVFCPHVDPKTIEWKSAVPQGAIPYGLLVRVWPTRNDPEFEMYRSPLDPK